MFLFLFLIYFFTMIIIIIYSVAAMLSMLWHCSHSSSLVFPNFFNLVSEI